MLGIGQLASAVQSFNALQSTHIRNVPITLHTDASDYGVGGYLFQTVDGIDH